MIDPATAFRNLELGGDQVWSLPGAGQAVSYPGDGNLVCAELEDDSFWYEHRNRIIRAALRHFPPAGAILDVGGGNGVVAAALREDGIVTCLLNPDPIGIGNAKRRGIELLIRARFEDVDPSPGGIPAVGLFDVLEHIQDDEAFLVRCADSLQPTGRLALTVPAGPALWSKHDEAAGHIRRYTLPGITALLSRASFAIDYATHFFSALVLPVLLFRVVPYRLTLAPDQSAHRKRREHRSTRSATGRLLKFLLHHEVAAVGRARVLKWGTSLLVMAHKPS